MNDPTQTPVPAPVQVTPEQELSQLRLDRASGKITDYEWNNAKFARFEQLSNSQHAPADAEANVSNGQAPREVSGMPLTIDQKLEVEIDAYMLPAKPQEYSLGYEPGFQHDEFSLKFDADIRAGFSEAGIPKHLADPIFQASDRVYAEMQHAPPEEQQQRVASTVSALQSRWGDQFDSRRTAVIETLLKASTKSEQIGRIIDEAPWMLADESIWVHLDTVAQHQARKRA